MSYAAQHVVRMTGEATYKVVFWRGFLNTVGSPVLVAVPESSDSDGAHGQYAVNAFYRYDYYEGIGWKRRPHDEFTDEESAEGQFETDEFHRYDYYSGIGWRRMAHDSF